MTRLLPLALLLSAAAAPAFAQAPTKDPAHIAGGTYVVDPDHTQVLFGVNHLGFSTYFGHFSGASGTLALTPQTPATSTFDITLPVASVATTSPKLDGELKSADWLDAGKYPTITFHGTGIQTTGADAAQVTGLLTLHGVTKPVTLNVTLNGAGPNPFFKQYVVGFQASGTLKRSDFGVKTYLPAIGDEVSLTISAAFLLKS